MCIRDSAIFLQSVEENLSAMEEELLASLPNRFYERLIVWRRDLVALHACYDQLSSMGESLRASTSPLIQEEDRLAFGYLSDRAERFLPVSYTHLPVERALWRGRRKNGIHERRRGLLPLLRRGGGTVSYTHLDVYKRQASTCVKAAFCAQSACAKPAPA